MVLRRMFAKNVVKMTLYLTAMYDLFHNTKSSRVFNIQYSEHRLYPLLAPLTMCNRIRNRGGVVFR